MAKQKYPLWQYAESEDGLGPNMVPKTRTRETEIERLERKIDSVRECLLAHRQQIDRQEARLSILKSELEELKGGGF